MIFSTEDITVTIEGKANTGKTILLSIFARALREAGYTNVMVMNPEEQPEKIYDYSSPETLPQITTEHPTLLGMPVIFRERHIPRARNIVNDVRLEAISAEPTRIEKLPPEGGSNAG